MINFLLLASIVFAGSPLISDRALIHSGGSETRVELDPSYTLKSAILVDVDRGKSILDIQSTEQLGIASITKVMTAYVASSLLEPDAVITLSRDAVLTYGITGEFRPGEQIYFRDAVAAMMIASSNDAAVAIAEDVGRRLGGETFEERINIFVRMMNREAERLGMIHTEFRNPTGLDEEGRLSNVSSVRDLYILTEIAKEIPYIWEVSREETKTIYSIDGTIAHTLTNRNKLLDEFSNVMGGKTGTTDMAGESIIVLLDDVMGRPYVFILLGADSDRRFIEAAHIIRSLVEL